MNNIDSSELSLSFEHNTYYSRRVRLEAGPVTIELGSLDDSGLKSLVNALESLAMDVKNQLEQIS